MVLLERDMSVVELQAPTVGASHRPDVPCRRLECHHSAPLPDRDSPRGAHPNTVTVGLEFVDEIHTVQARSVSRRQFCRGSPGRSPAPPCIHRARSRSPVVILRLVVILCMGLPTSITTSPVNRCFHTTGHLGAFLPGRLSPPLQFRSTFCPRSSCSLPC